MHKHTPQEMVTMCLELLNHDDSAIVHDGEQCAYGYQKDRFITIVLPQRLIRIQKNALALLDPVLDIRYDDKNELVDADGYVFWKKNDWSAKYLTLDRAQVAAEVKFFI